ncbi:hypothetical protein BD410DRAFT_846531 [Rickenella mellea]|uniref:Uncharacterized protein n=1 Tax=Rickenella mellea TaxID=50990 RepID=A0A4Y7PER4_9AGAM|nr:hypothetical protein BD410DRAFT_846531 [Rickenella mellea]
MLFVSTSRRDMHSLDLEDKSVSASEEGHKESQGVGERCAAKDHLTENSPREKHCRNIAETDEKEALSQPGSATSDILSSPQPLSFTKLESYEPKHHLGKQTYREVISCTATAEDPSHHSWLTLHEPSTPSKPPQKSRHSQHHGARWEPYHKRHTALWEPYRQLYEHLEKERSRTKPTSEHEQPVRYNLRSSTAAKRALGGFF